MEEYDVMALFHVDYPEEPVSRWWDWIFARRLLKGKADYYLAKSRGEYAVFNISDPDNSIGGWIEDLLGDYIKKGESDYYMIRYINETDGYGFLVYNAYKPTPLYQIIRELANKFTIKHRGKEDISITIEDISVFSFDEFIKYANEGIFIVQREENLYYVLNRDLEIISDTATKEDIENMAKEVRNKHRSDIIVI
ncbi:MAG TPA: hypothetical protein ENO30_05660 [Thermodesulfobium narugense]|nr:hypothetical protein [Thermodesulfobium narugense]